MVLGSLIVEWSVIQMVIWRPVFSACYLNGDLNNGHFSNTTSYFSLVLVLFL